MELTINPNRIDLDEAYMQMAEIWAKRSKANRKQVGALIVKDRQIISDGYNGLPAGDEDDVCEYWHYDPNDERAAGHSVSPVLLTKPEVLHAESNALAKIAENGGVGAQGATLYITMSPCAECAKLIKQAKIKRVVFREQYRETGGIDFLLKRGVQVEQLVPKERPLEDRLAAFQGNGQVYLAPAPEVARQTQPVPAPPPPPPKPAPPPPKPTPLMASVVNAAPAPWPQVPQDPVLPPLPRVIPPVEQQSEEEIAAMLAAATALLGGAPPPPKKSSLGDDDGGAYRSSFQ